MTSLVIPTFTLLLFLLSPTPILATDIVMDASGVPVSDGAGTYYMYQYPTPPGQGPIGWTTGTNSCPLYVTKEPIHESTITLHSDSFQPRSLPEGRIAIKFNDENTPCNKLLSWFAGPFIEPDTEDQFLTLKAGSDDILFPFVIKKSGEGNYVYELEYCAINGACYPVYSDPENGINLKVWPNADPETKPFLFELLSAYQSKDMAM